jgi:4-amino-4-deoxy-L-arabinose transferase-like glycosyltransferase
VSLLGAVFAVVMTGFMSSRLFGRRVGLSAAVLLAACLSLGFEAKIAKTDAALLATVVVAQFALLQTYLGPKPSRWLSAAFWAALGAGVLLKGPIILLVVGLTIITVSLWSRDGGWLKRLRPLWGVPLMLAIALPWYIAIGVESAGEFYRIAIGHSLMGKVAAGQQAHGAPFGYHLVGFPITFWPGSLLAVMAIPFVWRERKEPAIRFLLSWIIPSWIVFELVKTKLPHYVLPTFPAIACLASMALFNRPAPVKAWVRWLFLAFFVLWVALSAALCLLAPTAIWIYAKHVSLIATVLSLAALLSVGALIWCVIKRKAELAILAVAGASYFASTNVYAIALPQLQTFWLSPRIAELAQTLKPCPDSRLISTPYHEPSLVFLNGPARTDLADTPEIAADAMAKAGACGMAIVGDAQRTRFLARASQLGLSLQPVGAVQGRDYADNRNLRLTLFDAIPSSPPKP